MDGWRVKRGGQKKEISVEICIGKCLFVLHPVPEPINATSQTAYGVQRT